ncbi:GntR family transcriptional regulator [Enterobacter sp. DTU_2021_1002640_1_SI_PRY_ASU_LCPMC_013]|uniref:GntR family transcriptional regulator n=1 Tax=Enterobacter sp. DTU_2021_1002640_1_SI_PRY_ASU_LCPMC_013 TaxID=3077940 RepID=UPI0028E4BFF3|nr:GntR family transcriptional regulator [Enterobacter sp. DTU_2021_1002640_1_SI_PRY_ASU_LCPMC_013]WNU99171.1 GntR family transcriptional regulator [Enterobacter sp. DTU_2021_1002640_1_SI_PRY_ASU_LCPMC_013]
MHRNLPIYMQIREALRNGIAQNVYKQGELLPSENELAAQFNTTRATVVHAMQGLLNDGLIERVRGRGTFVKNSSVVTVMDTQTLGFFEKDLIGVDKHLEYHVVEFTPVTTSELLQTKLMLSKKERIHRLLRLRLINQQPIALEIRYMPSIFALQIDKQELEANALQNIFEHVLRIDIQTITNQVRVALPDQEAAQQLKIKRTRPILVRQHTYLTSDNKPVLWGETLYREEYEIHYTSHRQTEAEHK